MQGQHNESGGGDRDRTAVLKNAIERVGQLGKPGGCIRCEANGPIGSDTLNLIAEAGDGLSAEEVWLILCVGALDQGWGAAGKDADDLVQIVCPDCANGQELGEAHHIVVLTKTMAEIGPPSEN